MPPNKTTGNFPTKTPQTTIDLIIKLYTEGTHRDIIAAQTGISKGTVNRYINEFEAGTLRPSQEKSSSPSPTSNTNTENQPQKGTEESLKKLARDMISETTMLKLYSKATDEGIDINDFIQETLLMYEVKKEVERRVGTKLDSKSFLDGFDKAVMHSTLYEDLKPKYDAVLTQRDTLFKHIQLTRTAANELLNNAEQQVMSLLNSNIQGLKDVLNKGDLN